MSENSSPPTRRRSEGLETRAAHDAALPPHPLDKLWYASVEGKTYGPYSGHEIRQMIEREQILDSDFVCPEGGSSWTHASNDPLIGALFRRKPTTTHTVTSPVSAEGGTVIQVTNNIPHSAATAALLLETGSAAPKSPGIALLLSLLICGVGQMYNGQVGKGILMLIGCVLLWIALLGWIVWIWSMIDAYSTAKQMNLRYQQRILAGLS